MAGRRGRGGRKARGGARPSVETSQEPASAPADKENEPTAQRTTGMRTLRPTAHADPMLLENMRPGRVESTHEWNTTSSPEPEVDNIGFFNQQQGLGSDDEDYVEPSRRRQVSHAANTAQGIMGTGSEAASEGQPFSAITHTAAPLASVAPQIPASSLSGRLGQLYGPHTHSFPQPRASPSSNASEVRDLLNPVPTATSLFTKSTSMVRSRHSRPLSMSTPSHSHISHSRLTSLPPSTPTPTIGRKRIANVAFSDAEDEDGDCDDDINNVRRRKKAVSNANRPRYKDYSDDAALSKVVCNTRTRLQVHFSTTDPFPSADAKAAAVHQTFTAAREAFEHDDKWYNLTCDDEKLLGGEDTSMRSRVRKEAVSLVARAYGLHDSPTTAAEVAQNKDRVAFVLAESRFQYQSPENKTGRFRHPIISEIVNAVWFSHRNALGCIYQDRFNPVSAKTLALVLTAIQHALNMYTSGQKKDAEKFKAAAWPRFDEYLLALKQFETGEMEQLWLSYRKQLFHKGLAHACALQETVQPEHIIALVPDDEMQREVLRLKASLQPDGNCED
ncbi:hypothetical protein B0H21DRAFT_893609 [Amylocystis lapponica]|nr:hypothetical protein B0H21DRAFT_893609 [Amylocystis lapponica]